MDHAIAALLTGDYITAGVYIVGAILAALIGAAAVQLQRYTALKVDVVWRDKLHAALMTIVAAQAQRLREHLGKEPSAEAIQTALRRSVKGELAHINPDTAKHFEKVSAATLTEVATQYITS